MPIALTIHAVMSIVAAGAVVCRRVDAMRGPPSSGPGDHEKESRNTVSRRWSELAVSIFQF